MEFTELAKLLKKQNESGNGFLIHLNADDLEEKSHRNTSVEFGDLHFTNCQSVRNGEMLVFDNSNREPVDHKVTEHRFIHLIVTVACILILRRLRQSKRKKMAWTGS